MARPNSARMRAIKRALADRDGAGCFYCGHPFATLLGATVDHLIPQSALPGWALMNLVLACRPCNEAKADQLPQVFLRAAGCAPPAARRCRDGRTRSSPPSPRWRPAWRASSCATRRQPRLSPPPGDGCALVAYVTGCASPDDRGPDPGPAHPDHTRTNRTGVTL
ncbi:HNH endonuclease [Micromonospora matsumotoense]|uniref:HNH endonuclease n=1 Tax=Micromonospora matsumotoense TaxID=121616 RepID=UPI000B857B9D|nr:HNH endonuclease [Micromonospora matsumotoense]